MHWGQRGKSSKNADFRGKRHDNKILKVREMLLSLRRLLSISKDKDDTGPRSFFLRVCTFAWANATASIKRVDSRDNVAGECFNKTCLLWFRDYHRVQLPSGAPGLPALLNYFGTNFRFDYTYTYTFNCFGN